MNVRMSLVALLAVAIGAASWVFFGAKTAGDDRTLAPTDTPFEPVGADRSSDAAALYVPRVEPTGPPALPLVERVEDAGLALEESGLPEPPADPELWSSLQWRRYHLTKFLSRIEWDASPGPNGDVKFLYFRALATLEDARGQGPLQPWDPDYEALIALGQHPDDDRLVVLINGEKYRFYPQHYPELTDWYNASWAGHDPEGARAAGVKRRMDPGTLEIIRARAEEALLLLPSLTVH